MEEVDGLVHEAKLEDVVNLGGEVAGGGWEMVEGGWKWLEGRSMKPNYWMLIVHLGTYII